MDTRCKDQGFTLLEMAISMIVIGLLLGSAFYAYSIYKMREEDLATRSAVSTVATALYGFKNAHGRYPCPAPILEDRDTSSNYGHETLDCRMGLAAPDVTLGTGTPVNPGECLTGASVPDYNGICIEKSTRMIAAQNPRVRVGAIPFRELQIEEKDTFDGYGSRLVYAVTENMTNAETYNDGHAAIEIRDGAGNILSGDTTSVAFLVFSPGKNKNGAVSKDGIPAACNVAANIFDGQNCRDFAVTTDTDSVYVMEAKADGTNLYDDVMEYFVPSENAVWRRQAPTSENMVDLSEDKIGVGVQTPSELTDDLVVRNSTLNNTSVVTDYRALATTNTTGGAHQSGALRVGKFSGGAHSGKVLANGYCDEFGANCFDPARITGAYDGDPVAGTSGMGCPAGQYMTGVEAGRAKCAPVRISCAAGQAIIGFNADGSPICAIPLQSCLGVGKTVCADAKTLPPTGDGVTQTIYANNSCAYQKWKCNNGLWSMTGSYETVHACSFIAATPPTGNTPGLTCAAGYTGTYTQNWYLNCAGNKINTTNTAATDCTCVGKTDKVLCDATFGGTWVGTKERHCVGGVLEPAPSVFKDLDGTIYPTEAALKTAKCSCAKTESWKFTNKPGHVRKGAPTPAIFILPDASWPPAPAMCQYGKQTVNTTTCNYNAVSYNDSNCVCAGGTQFRNQNPTCGLCDEVDTVGLVRQIRGGGTCDWMDDPDTSANTVGTCKPKNFIWKSSGSTVAAPKPLADGNGGRPICGSACACGQNGDATICAVSNTIEWNFYSSVCQPN